MLSGFVVDRVVEYSGKINVVFVDAEDLSTMLQRGG